MRILIRNPNAALLDGTFYDTNGLVYNQDSEEWEEPLDAEIPNYVNPFQVSSRTDLWYLDFPEGYPAGVYDLEVTERQGAAAAADDPVTEFPAMPSRIQWDGAGEAVLASLAATSQANAVAAGLDAGVITAHRGDTFSQPITVQGSLIGRTKLWFTVKARPATDEDSDALIQIVETVGLVYLNSAVAGTPSWGSLTVTNAGAGQLTISLHEDAVALLKPGRYRYDVQVKNGSGTFTRGFGEFIVPADVTRATS